MMIGTGLAAMISPIARAGTPVPLSLASSPYVIVSSIADRPEGSQDCLGDRFQLRQVKGKRKFASLTGEVLPQLPESPLHHLIGLR